MLLELNNDNNNNKFKHETYTSKLKKKMLLGSWICKINEIISKEMEISYFQY
jgi:hypothetical protein